MHTGGLPASFDRKSVPLDIGLFVNYFGEAYLYNLRTCMPCHVSLDGSCGCRDGCTGDKTTLTKSLELLPPVCAAMSASAGITVPQDRLKLECYSVRESWCVVKSLCRLMMLGSSSRCWTKQMLGRVYILDIPTLVWRRCLWVLVGSQRCAGTRRPVD